MPAKIRHARHRSFKGINRDRLDHLASDLAQGVIQEGRFTEHVFTGTAFATNEITIAGQDTIPTATRTFLYGDDLPLGLESGVLYYMADGGTDEYTLHLSAVDAANAANAVAFTDAGTGTLTAVLLD